MRVLSLLPSATEILWAIGAGDLQVGRSHDCDYPAEVTRLPAVTSKRITATTSIEINQQVRRTLQTDHSLYTIDENTIRALQPDVILTQDSCAVCSIDLPAVERLAQAIKPNPIIVNVHPTSLSDVFDDGLRIGRLVGRAESARHAVTRWKTRIDQARHFVNAYITGPEVAFLDWINPLFVGGRWIPELIEMAGAQHSLNQPGGKSVAVSSQALVASRPEYLIIAPCGESIQWAQEELSKELASQPWWQQLPAVINNKSAIVDGRRMFNVPGPKLVDAFCFLVGWLNDAPPIIPDDFHWERPRP